MVWQSISYVFPSDREKAPLGGTMEIGGRRPPDGQPSLDREGVAAGDGWDDEWMICICDSAVSVGLYQSSPPTAARSPPFKGGFSFSPLRGQPVLWQLATLMGNGEMIDSSNRFCPLTAVAELSRGRASRLWISSFVTSMFYQSASYVPCDKDEPTRPLRGHPSSTRGC